MCEKMSMSMSEAGKLGAIASRPIIEQQKQERIEKYNTNPKLCIFCSTPISYENRVNKYCGHSCAAKYNNLIRGYEAHKRLPECMVCAGKIKKGGHKYCSLKCQQVDKWNEMRKRIEQEQKFDGKTQARRYLLETHGHKCMMSDCGITEWRGKPVLLICDHINGNSDDWNLNNIRMICSNCDATTPYYKARNRGNGRHYRRQRYKEGKSY